MGAVMGTALCVHPSAHKSRERSQSEKPQGQRYSHHTPDHKKVLLETPCNDSPPQALCSRVLVHVPWTPMCHGWHGEPVLVEPEICVRPGRKQWAEVAWEANSPMTASTPFAVPGRGSTLLPPWHPPRHKAASGHLLPHGLTWHGMAR